MVFTVLAGAASIYSVLKPDRPPPQSTTVIREVPPRQRDYEATEIDPVVKRLDDLVQSEQYAELELQLMHIQGDPKYTRHHAFYSLLLAVCSPGHEGTPPEFYFSQIDVGSPFYMRAVQIMARMHYIDSQFSWQRARPAFARLARQAHSSGRVFPVLFFLDFAALGPQASYAAIDDVYQKFLAVYGKCYDLETGNLVIVVNGDEPMNREVIAVPNLLLLFNQQLAIAADREGRSPQRQRAIQAVRVLVHDYFFDDWNAIRERMDAFYVTPEFLDQQRTEFQAVSREK